MNEKILDFPHVPGLADWSQDHPVLDLYIVRVSLNGRSCTVEGPADKMEGACFQRQVICQCVGPDAADRAKRLARLLNDEDVPL